jgi:hypothetical protein
MLDALLNAFGSCMTCLDCLWTCVVGVPHYHQPVSEEDVNMEQANQVKPRSVGDIVIITIRSEETRTLLSAIPEEEEEEEEEEDNKEESDEGDEADEADEADKGDMDDQDWFNVT